MNKQNYNQFVHYFKNLHQPNIDLQHYFGDGLTMREESAALLGEAVYANEDALGVLLQLAIHEKNTDFLKAILQLGAKVSDLDAQGNPIWFEAFTAEFFTQSIVDIIKHQDDFHYFQRNQQNETIYEYGRHLTHGVFGISVNQSKILNQIEKYLNFRDALLAGSQSLQADPEYFKSIAKGVCYGLTILQWFCQHVSQKELETGNTVLGAHDRVWFENTINAILKWKPTRNLVEFYVQQMPIIEEFLSIVKSLQNAEELGFSQFEGFKLFNMMIHSAGTMTQDNEIHVEYVYNGLHTSMEVANGVWGLLRDNKNVIIVSGLEQAHAVNLYRFGNSVWFYDSSGKLGFPILVTSAKQITQLLSSVMTFQQNPNTAIPCSIQVNGLGAPGLYPKQSEFYTLFNTDQPVLNVVQCIANSISWCVQLDSAENLVNLCQQLKTRCNLSEADFLRKALVGIATGSAHSPNVSMQIIQMILAHPELGKDYLVRKTEYLITQAFSFVRPKIYLLEQLIKSGVDDLGKIHYAIQHNTAVVPHQVGENQADTVDKQLVKMFNYFRSRVNQARMDSQEYIVLDYLIKRCYNTKNAADFDRILQFIKEAWFAIIKTELPKKQTNVHPKLNDLMAILIIQSLDPKLSVEQIAQINEFLTRCDNTKDSNDVTLLKLIQEAKGLIQANALMIKIPNTFLRNEVQLENVHRMLQLPAKSLMEVKAKLQRSHDASKGQEIAEIDALLARFNNTKNLKDIKPLLLEAKKYRKLIPLENKPIDEHKPIWTVHDQHDQNQQPKLTKPIIPVERIKKE